MIKDAEDKGLITPGKVSFENSPYLHMLFQIWSYRFNFASLVPEELNPNLPYCPILKLSS
jgi:hypothetical protein